MASIRIVTVPSFEGANSNDTEPSALSRECSESEETLPGPAMVPSATMPVIGCEVSHAFTEVSLLEVVDHHLVACASQLQAGSVPGLFGAPAGAAVKACAPGGIAAAAIHFVA